MCVPTAIRRVKLPEFPGLGEASELRNRRRGVWWKLAAQLAPDPEAAFEAEELPAAYPPGRPPSVDSLEVIARDVLPDLAVAAGGRFR